MNAFDDLFGADYLYFWEAVLPKERTERETDLVWRLLGLEPGMEVLDLACGHGRMTNRLAQRGARMTGLDSSELFLERAREDAQSLGVDVEYVHEDMRAIPWKERFDAVLNWFTAFGYHPDDELHAILCDVRAALKPSGRFAVELTSVTGLMQFYRPHGITERDGDFLLETRRYDPLRGGFETEFIAMRGGETRRYPVFIRSPTYTELRDWLASAGFERVDGFGEDGEPLKHEHRRMIAVATAAPART
ncbi:MAG: SAM-dependent methyltransferase [Gaiellaceae bacterium]